jgi:hypothetical protein
MFGKVDQMSRDEVEARLSQLMGSVVLEDKTEPDPALVDLPEASQEDIDTMTDKEEEERFDEGWTEDKDQEGIN